MKKETQTKLLTDFKTMMSSVPDRARVIAWPVDWLTDEVNLYGEGILVLPLSVEDVKDKDCFDYIQTATDEIMMVRFSGRPVVISMNLARVWVLMALDIKLPEKQDDRSHLYAEPDHD